MTPSLALLGLVLPLGLDTLAVSASLGLAGVSPRRRFRVSLVLVAFETLMPLVGLGLGSNLAGRLGALAPYLVAATLVLLGVMALREKEEADEARRLAAAEGWGLALLGLGVSLDELALGAVLGLAGAPLGPAVALIAIQALVFSQLGLRLGSHLATEAGEWAEKVGGGLLLVAGLAVMGLQLAGHGIL